MGSTKKIKVLLGKTSHKLRDHYLRKVNQKIYKVLHFYSKVHVGEELTIKCFCQARNEVDIIEDWILYHGYLFGMDNVYVLDDGSDDGTEKVLEKYQGRAKIVWLDKPHRGLREKSENLGRIMEKERRKADVLIPLDADEFIALPGSCDRTRIRKSIANELSWRDWGLYKFSGYYESVPLKENDGRPVGEIVTFRRVREVYEMKKVYFRASNYVAVGFGQHAGYVNSKIESAYLSDLILIHYSVRGKQQFLKKCLNGVQGYNYDPSYKGGSGYFGGYNAFKKGKFDDFYDQKNQAPDIKYDVMAKKINELRSLA